MTASHTPGPWSWVEGPTEDESASLVSADGSEICSFGSYGSAHDQTAGWEPNDLDKALIAAAPDMFDALQDALAALEISGQSDCVTSRVRAAIAKARGEAC